MAFPRRRVLRGHGLILALAFATSATLAACAAAQQPVDKKVVENMPDARALDGRRAALPDGQYTCTIQGDDGDKYPSFPCVVATSNGQVRLEKVAGSQRIRGAVTMTEGGFRFEGEFFCPYGDCAEPVVAEFHRTGDERHYVGVIKTSTGVIRFDLRYRSGGTQAYNLGDQHYDVAPASAPVDHR